jgi:nitrile hydratase subunit beta
MNGPHDLGGAQGFGPINPETDEPVFHAEWERRAAALSLAMNSTGMWNIDIVRHARERIPPAEYVAASYYEKWLKGLERLLLENGLVTPEELKSGHSAAAGIALKNKPVADAVPAMLAKGSRYDRPPTAPALYGVGDHVRTKQINPTGHTRLPRYARGRNGRIAAVHGVHVFPDTNSARRDENPQWLYSVAFDARELWGDAAHDGDDILIDLWEPYLERA